MIENGYGICFNDWLFDKEIKNELRLLIVISSLSAKLGYCTASNEYLSGLFGEHNKTISERIGKLEKLNYIRCEYGKLGGAVLWRKIYVTRLQQMTTRKKSNDYPRVTKRLPANNEMTTRNNNSISNNIKDKTMVLSYMGGERKNFVAPSFDEVKNEFDKRGYTETLAQKFIDHYESNGWMVGKNRMKSWVHAITTWTTNPENDRFKKKDTKKDAYLEMLGDVDDLF
jgi:hypothetical protein